MMAENINIVLDAGTTWSKIVEKSSSTLMKNYNQFLVKNENGFNYYVLPSAMLKDFDFKFDRATGHMSLSMLKDKKDYEKEVQADGFYTTERGVLLTISIADCGSVLFHDDDFTVVGALHCGWRGTRDGVIQNMLRELSQFVEQQKLSAYIGPMISKENYEVGPEFQEYFPTEFLTARNNSLYLDLNGCVEAILREGNVGKIYNAQLDTFSNPDLFFSYRRDGQTGRMCSFIGLK